MMWKYALAWFGMMVLAILNGGLRDLVYKQYVGDLAAHQISTVCLLLLFTGFMWALTKAWPIKSAGQTWIIGTIWFIMTEAFEFGTSRFVSGKLWSETIHAYNLLAGQVWVLIPVWVLVGPYVFHRYIQKGKSQHPID